MPAASARPFRAILAIAGAGTLLAACGGGSSGASAQPTATVTATAVASPSATASPTASTAAGTPPAMVAVTTAGALVVIDPATGAVSRTLVPSGVLGDEISVAPDGTTVYFAHGHGGCAAEIESVPVSGGTPVMITAGSLPAISPDGTKLAIAREPLPTTGCIPNEANLTAQYKLVARTLATGAETTYHMLPAGQSSGLPAPISHLSWASDNARLAVSISSVQDNEGWNVVIVDTPAAKYYLSGAGDSDVPVTGQPNARDSYLREGVFMPNGSLFVSRACCGGVPVRNTSRLMWEVSSSGVLVHQVAIGFASLDHTSLDADTSGRWLLYLAGNDLYVSANGATPRKLASGLIAAAWE
jgi:WD40-like Beta Propeller Repeat